MIDLHCHILPGIDDGPGTMEEALDLARLAVRNGIGTIVATPHVSWDYPANTGALIQERVVEVNEALRSAAIDLEVLPGAEIALSKAVDLDDAAVSALRLGGGSYILLECPLTPTITGFENAVWEIHGRGHEVVLGHPERSPGLRRDRDLLDRLVRGGAVSQVTAGSFAGKFGREVQRAAREMLEAGLVHNVASDAHSLVRRPPSIAAELADAGLAAHAELLTVDVPRAVLEGTPVPEAPRVQPAGWRDKVRGTSLRRRT